MSLKRSSLIYICTLGLLVNGCSSSGTKPSSSASAPATVFGKISRAVGPAGSAGYNLRPYSETTLENGLTVLYVEDNTLPYVSYGLMLKTGSTSDPVAFPGLSMFVSEMLAKGTAKHSALEIAESLGRIGADFSASVTRDYTMISASSLSMHADRLLGDLAEIVTQPAFSAAEVTRMRKQILAAIRKRVDNPSSFADTLWEDFLFGHHPYSKPVLGTSRSVAAIKRKHLIQHYLRHYRPNDAILAVTGKLTPELVQKIEKTFSTWEKREVPAITYPQVPEISKVEIRLVDKPGLVQTQIRMGHKGIRRQNADFIPLRVANTILGGAFASRLMDRVRKQLGLTYGISSGFDARIDYGPFEISTFTKNESTAQAITETLNVVRNFKKSGVTDEEVTRVKGYLKGVFPTAIETAEKFAYNLLLLRLYNIPDSYLSNYLSDLDRIDTDDVNRVIKRYFDPQNMKVLVYTDAKTVLPQLQPIGVVEVKKASDFQ